MGYITIEPTRSEALKQAQLRYRDKNRIRYNEYQRELAKTIPYDPAKRQKYYLPIKNELDAFRQVRKLFN